MSEMVEPVARALARVHFSRRQHYGACTKEERVAFLVDQHWRNHIDDARAAIEAMREPTREMVRAAREEDGVDESAPESFGLYYRNIYAGMVDAALSNSPKRNNG